MKRRVAVTGLGCVSGLGQGVDATWRAAVEGRGAITIIDRVLDNEPAWAFSGPAAPGSALDLSAVEARLGPRALGGLDPQSTFAVVATFEALSDAGLLDDEAARAGAAVIYGCGGGGYATMDAAYHRLYARRLSKTHPQTVPRSMNSATASHISMLFGVRGPSFVVTSACASSNHALGEAMHMVRSGRVEVAIAGGADAILQLGPWLSWSATGAMAGDTCRPFSAGRRGMVLGEGAATLVLEDWDRAVARGARIHGELAGYGASADAAHLTAPDLGGVQAAITAAHVDAGVSPEEPALISTHGTGTPLNDKTEAEAIRRTYGRALAHDTVIATKSAHGHLMGGSGAIELILGLKALEHGTAPPILNWLGPDPECELPLAMQPTPVSQRVLVSNSFAFGGLNAVLVATKA